MIKALSFWLMAGSASLVLVNPASAQSTGFQGFLQRAGSAVSQSASAVLGKKGTASPAGTTSTTGDYFRPTSPVDGEFHGLFDHWKPGDAWPRASVYFTDYGSQLPCWTARAVIWRSAVSHHEETFQVCNAPIVIHDDMGTISQVGGPGISEQMSSMLTLTRNIQGITHADTASTRNAGPNPPAMPFNVSITGLESSRIRPMYDAVIIRLAWVTGYIAPGDSDVTNTPGKVLWIAGFDPAGNHDKDMP